MADDLLVVAQGYDASKCGLISGLAMPYPAGIGYVAAAIAGDFDLGLDYAVQLIQSKLQSQASNGTQQNVQVGGARAVLQVTGLQPTVSIIYYTRSMLQ